METRAALRAVAELTAGLAFGGLTLLAGYAGLGGAALGLDHDPRVLVGFVIGTIAAVVLLVVGTDGLLRKRRSARVAWSCGLGGTALAFGLCVGFLYYASETGLFT
ncbi:MAG TPA: hypothetical protein VJT75_16440 [Thermoleophilaceae bacterium]|nr:hypothetical protein [Thermoleophilaceae bacterium]